MPARIVRPLVLLALLTLLVRYCCFSPAPEPPLATKASSDAAPQTTQPPAPQAAPSPTHLLIFCDQYILQDATKRANILGQLEQKFLTGAGNVCSPVTIELFALDCNTARGNNLLPNCHIEPKESDMINRGSFIARKAVANRWLEDFDNLNATTPNTCTQVLASLHVLGSRLRGAAPDETIKVIYITAWKEMDIAHDFELQTYRMLSKNEKEGGTYRFKWSVLEEMFRQLNDPGSQMRQITTNLKNTLAQLAPPSPKIYYLQGIQHHLKDDGGTNGEVQLAAFWDSLFSCAGLQRIGKNNLAECLQ